MGEMGGGLNVREGERERESAHNTNRSMSSLSSMYGFFFTRLTSSWAMSWGKGGDGVGRRLVERAGRGSTAWPTHPRESAAAPRRPAAHCPGTIGWRDLMENQPGGGGVRAVETCSRPCAAHSSQLTNGRPQLLRGKRLMHARPQFLFVGNGQSGGRELVLRG